MSLTALVSVHVHTEAHVAGSLSCVEEITGLTFQAAV